MLAGLAMMLRWDKLGALVTAIGTVAFFAGIGFHGFPSIALINLVPIGCFGIYWLAEWKLRTTGAGALGFTRPQKLALAALGTALVAFVLACANEMLGNPPLMTPALHPAPALAGAWHARAQAWPGPSEIEILLTVNADGTVSGRIGGATVSGARITGNRTRLGRVLHWRTDYIIRGELSGTAVPTQRNGNRFTAPLNFERPALVGSIFTSGLMVSRLRLEKM